MGRKNDYDKKDRIKETYMLEDLTSEEKKALAERFKKSKGKFLVLVHPFYGSTVAERELAEEYSRYLFSLHKKLKTNTHPIIAYVEEHKIGAFKELAKSMSPKAPFIIVPTAAGSSIPLLKCSPKKGEEHTLKKEFVRRRIRQLGGKEYEIGGERAWYTRAKAEVYAGCVSGVDSGLSARRGDPEIKEKGFKGKADPAITFPERSHRKGWEARFGTKKRRR